MSQSDDIKIRTMLVEDYVVVKPFLRAHFYSGEPLTMSSGENVEKCDETNTDNYNLKMIKEGTSLVAEDPSGRIVGLILAGAQYPSDLEHHRKQMEQMEPHIWGRIFRFLSKVELEANIFERYGISKVLYSHMTNVDASMRGKGLGTRLVDALMKVGREKGFPAVVAYCTSFYSARQKIAVGWECIHSQSYADYKDSNGEVIFKPPAPHVACQVVAKRL